MSKKQPSRRNLFSEYVPVTTRWHDNDIYGHINNVTFYSFFDTAANSFLIHECGLDIHQGDTIGLVVQSNCNYHAPAEFPVSLEVGVAILRLGNSSVTWQLAVFAQGQETALADGTFTHVLVNRETRRPVVIPPQMRAALERLVIGDKQHR